MMTNDQKTAVIFDVMNRLILLRLECGQPKADPETTIALSREVCKFVGHSIFKMPN